MGLLDGFSEFVKTPEGQGLLSAAFSGMARAQKGNPWNTAGAAGLGGVMGYQRAVDLQDRQNENAVQNKVRQMQIDDYGRKQAALGNLKTNVPENLRPFVDVAPDLVIKSMFKEPSKPELVTVQTPDGPVQRWVRPGEATGTDIGAPVNKEAALPWYVKRNPDGQTSIDPAYADFEKSKAASGRPVTPFYNFLPTANGYAVGDARTGNIAPASINGAPVVKASDSPELQGKIAGSKEAATVKAAAESKREINMNGLGSMLNRAEVILTDKSNPPTHSGFGTAADSAGALVGVAPKGAAQADELRVIGGSLVSKMPRMEGPQSDKDVALYRESAGNVADSTLPIERRVAALKTVRALFSKYEKTPSANIDAPAQVRRYNPASGRIE